MKIAPFKIAIFAVLALGAGFGLGKLATDGLTGDDGNSVSGQSALPGGSSSAQSSLLGSKVPSVSAKGPIPGLLQGALAEEAAWLDRIESARVSDLPGLFTEAEQITGSSLRNQVRHLLLIRWLDLDPDDAFAAARYRKEANIAAGKSESFEPTLREFFNVWSRVDLDAALAAAAALEDDRESIAAYQAIARGRAEIDDPLEYLAFVKSLPKGAASGDLYASALVRIAETDREFAITEAIDLGWGPRINSLNAVYAQWSESDPHAALEDTRRLAGIGLPVRDRAIAAVLPELAKTDPDLAGDAYHKLHAPGLNRTQILSTIVDALAEQDPLGAAKWLGKFGKSSSANAQVIGDLVNQKLLTDPAAAVEIYNAVQGDNPPTHVKLQSLGDPTVALKLLGSLPDSFGKVQLQAGLLSQWASRDFLEAAAYAQSLSPDGDPFAGPGAQLFRNPSDLSAAWDYAAATPSEQSKKILDNLLRTIADSDPDLAIQKFQSLAPGEYREGVTRQLASHLARSDPYKAADFIATLPAGDLRNGALKVVSNSFASDDPFAASEWIANFPSGPERDIATTELVNVVQQFDPQSAFVWAAAIDDQNRRRQLLRNVISSWAGTDPAAAANQVRASELPGARKTELLTILSAP